MAAIPAYAATPHVMSGLIPGTADTSFTAPTSVTTLGTAGSSGTKVAQIDIQPVGTTVAGLVNIFAYDGTAYHLVESVPVTAATPGTTVAPVKTTYVYDNLVLPASTWSLRCTGTVAGNVSLVTVTAYGADF